MDRCLQMIYKKGLTFEKLSSIINSLLGRIVCPVPGFFRCLGFFSFHLETKHEGKRTDENIALKIFGDAF